jgi:hypothetical protein
MPPPSSANPAWIQANFIRPHGYDPTKANPFVGNFTVTEPGNPGPQPPLDLRDYQHAPVVPVSVNVSAN